MNLLSLFNVQHVFNIMFFQLFQDISRIILSEAVAKFAPLSNVVS